MSRVPKALILFHRHGHRAPAKNIFPSTTSFDKFSLDEHELWKSQCNIAHVTGSLDDRHPITVGTCPVQGTPPVTPHDSKTYPFGNLTSTGIFHLEHQAKDLCTTFPILTKFPLNNTTIHSTNYKRTQISAQVVWNAILRQHQDHKDSDNSEISHTFIPAAAEERRAGFSSGPRSPVPIVVRHPTQCILSFFDRASEVANSAIKEVQNLPKFRELAFEYSDVTRQLIEQFPRLGTHRSGFDWMGALDYFSCRRGHGLPILFAVAHLENKVYQHLIERFSLYLNHPKYLANFMGPLVAELCQLIETVEKHNGNSNSSSKISNDNSVNKFQFHVFSGHDINLLGLLFLLKATAVSTNPKTISSYAEFSQIWPDFGTTFVMEVQSCEEINIYMNAKPTEVDMQLAILSADVGVSAAAATGNGSHKSVTITLQELQLLYQAMQKHIVARHDDAVTEGGPNSGLF